MLSVYDKITKDKTNGAGTVQLVGVKNKKIKKLRIPNRVKIKGSRYKVTSIGPKALINCKKLKKLFLGKFIKKIGKKAIYGIHKKAVIKCPKTKKKFYKKILKKATGYRKTMKIK